MVFVVCLALVSLIALAQRQGRMITLDHGIMNGTGVLRDTCVGAIVTPIMRGVSMAGGTVGRMLFLLISCVVLMLLRRALDARWLFVVCIAGWLLNIFLKQIFAAPRPDLLPHLDIVHSYSFPSGHAADTMMLLGALAMILARRWAWSACAAMVVLIGTSRVWLGVHWPSDVLAGWIEGMGWLVLCDVLPFRSQGAVLHRLNSHAGKQS